MGVTLVIAEVVLLLAGAASVCDAEIDTSSAGFEAVDSAVVVTTVRVLFGLLANAASAIAVLLMHAF